MTTRRTVPSEVEPDRLADLIADCARLPRRIIDLTVPTPVQRTFARPMQRLLRLPGQRGALVIPDATKSMVDGYDDYGC